MLTLQTLIMFPYGNIKDVLNTAFAKVIRKLVKPYLPL